MDRLINIKKKGFLNFEYLFEILFIYKVFFKYLCIIFLLLLYYFIDLLFFLVVKMKFNQFRILFYYLRYRIYNFNDLEKF